MQNVYITEVEKYLSCLQIKTTGSKLKIVSCINGDGLNPLIAFWIFSSAFKKWGCDNTADIPFKRKNYFSKRTTTKNMMIKNSIPWKHWLILKTPLPKHWLSRQKPSFSEFDDGLWKMFCGKWKSNVSTLLKLLSLRYSSLIELLFRN